VSGKTISPAGVRPAPGWYSDPRGATRWWNGRQWTEKVATGGLAEGPTTPRTATVLAPTGAFADDPGPVASALEPVTSAIERWKPVVSSHRRAWLARGCVVVVVALLAGYVLFGRGGDDAGSPKQTAAFTALTAPQKAAAISLTGADLPPTLTAVPVARGTALTGPGSTSLSLCGAKFTSEAHRLARRNVSFSDFQGNVTGAQEVTTVYAGQVWAARAMAEWRKAVAGCNQRVSKVYAETGKTPARYSSLVTRPVTGLPTGNSSQTMFRVDVKGSRSYYGLVILQQQGNTIDAMVLSYTDPTDQAAVSAVTGFAQISGAKLEASAPAVARAAG
jgi:Protein of unknown function (DUF2510)